MKCVSGTAEISDMICRLLFFARAQELAGTRSLDVELETASKISDLRDQVVQKFPQLATMQNSLLWAVNQKYATDSTTLQPGDTVACFPPVSGG